MLALSRQDLFQPKVRLVTNPRHDETNRKSMKNNIIKRRSHVQKTKLYSDVENFLLCYYNRRTIFVASTSSCQETGHQRSAGQGKAGGDKYGLRWLNMQHLSPNQTSRHHQQTQVARSLHRRLPDLRTTLYGWVFVGANMAVRQGRS